MTAKAKALQLIKKMIVSDDVYYHDAKKCAIICAKEIQKVAWWSSTGIMNEPYRNSQKEYWQEVIEEIGKIENEKIKEITT